MTASAPPGVAPRLARVHLAGLVLLLLLALSVAAQWPWRGALATAWFDACQRLAPRRVASLPAVVVEIDDRSLSALGRWPWPRTVLADLVDAIERHRPAALGLDFLLTDTDPLAPRMARAEARGNGAPQGADSDAELARALRAAPAVLALAAIGAPSPAPLRVAPVAVISQADAATATRALPVPRYRGALASLPLLADAAHGWGLASLDGGASVRRVPLLADIDGTLVPALAVEMWRVARGASEVLVKRGREGVASLEIGGLVVPTDADGTVRVYYSADDARRRVSAVDLLEGRVAGARLTGKLVLVGLEGSVLGERVATPVGTGMAQGELQAQLLENLQDGTFLARPRFAAVGEALAFLVLGALLVAATPRWPARVSALLALSFVAVPLAAALAAFSQLRVLIDAATSGAALLVLYAAMLAIALAETSRQRRVLQGELTAEREAAAAVAGELAAARRIQLGTLPRPESLSDPRVDVAAVIQPAREVGGDLYDFFKIDASRLFFMIGDVAGKGVSASLFMAVTKALTKSVMLRAPDLDLGALVSTIDNEIARDNAELLFVSVAAGVLDLTDGTLALCNAGHEPAFLVHAHGGAHALRSAGGPPLCTVERYAYRADECRLDAGDVVVALTDGVTEARNAAAALYGRERLAALLARLACAPRTPADIVDAVRADVATFADGTEATDDLAVLAVRWNGPRGAP